MIESSDPLDGFLLYKNESLSILMTLGREYVRINSDALRVIGYPEYINIFFDERRKRMAIKASESTMDNAFEVSTSYGIRKCKNLWDKILDVAEMEWHPGEIIRFKGQKYGDDFIVFKLEKGKTIKFDPHLNQNGKTEKTTA